MSPGVPRAGQLPSRTRSKATSGHTRERVPAGKGGGEPLPPLPPLPNVPVVSPGGVWDPTPHKGGPGGPFAGKVGMGPTHPRGNSNA